MSGVGYWVSEVRSLRAHNACLSGIKALRLGYAAGCEAAAMPRRWTIHDSLGLRPCMARPSRMLGQSPNQGHSPMHKTDLPAGHSRRLTPGGKAVSDRVSSYLRVR